MRGRREAALPPLQRVIEEVHPLAETVWASLTSVRSARGPARILFTGTEGQAGTTVIAAATALGLARHTRDEVTIVEANLLRPALARYLGVPPEPGLAELLVGQCSLDQCRYDVPGCPGLRAVPGGTPRRATPGEFAAQGARQMLGAIAASGRYVLVDAPPILESPETRALLAHVDGVVLVLRARSSLKSEVKGAVKLIEQAGVEVLGSVLNRFKPELPFGVD